MTSKELLQLIDEVVASRSEFQHIELKAARNGCPDRLYDTLSSFSNRDDGGIIIFGIDEQNDFEKCGIYDLHDLQQKVTNQCNNMIPKVRPLFSYAQIDEKQFCSAEIPSIDISERPCHYAGKGPLKGSYIRVGTSDEPMSEYEIYSYEAYRKKYQDDIRPIARVSTGSIDQIALNNYLALLCNHKPNLSRLTQEQVAELVSVTVNGQYSLMSTLLFGLYPQAYFPQLCIIATAIPGTEMGQLGEHNERFTDNRRIEGTIPDMLNDALAFVMKNIRIKTIVDGTTGNRQDLPEYPITAIREIILNALVHRDYSFHTEGMPIQLQIFTDRIVVTNPGGLYGRISLNRLGQVQADTRNPALATALEALKITENRYSGIPTIRREMAEYGLPMPQFEDSRNSFRVTLFNERTAATKRTVDTQAILSFCSTPRTRQELANYLGIRSIGYAIATYITPLVEDGSLKLTKPNTPKSPRQQYVAK